MIRHTHLSLFILTIAIALTAAAGAGATDIAAAKLLPNGATVTITAKIVTLATTNYFYIQEPNDGTGQPSDLAGGLRVEKMSHGFTAGKWATVTGTMQTLVTKERYLACTSASTASTGAGSVAPWFMRSGSIGGGEWFYDSSTGAGQIGTTAGTGLSNVGTLVKMVGLVNYADAAGAFVYVDDGSAGLDGNRLDASGADIPGVRVLTPSITAPVTTTYVQVTGVSSLANLYGQRSPQVIASSVAQLSSTTILQTLKMARVSGGAFLMGNSGVGDDALHGYPREYPQHEVYVEPFFISKTEVTRGQFAAFKNAGGYTNSSYWSTAGWQWKSSVGRTQPDFWNSSQNFGFPSSFSQTDNHPVVGVTYYEAEAYCKWAGGRLPTEAEWEKAARWDGTPRAYPWGNAPAHAKSNSWYDAANKGSKTAAVGSYTAGASPYGCMDMAGNVWEWTSDWYRSYPGSDAPFDMTNSAKSVRGGGWNGLYGDRCACRWFLGPTASSSEVGFRIAK